MGSVVSQYARKALLRILALFSPAVRRLLQRLQASPGLPVNNPCESYWMSPPSPIAKQGADDIIPEYADVVIIGSGITGTSIARRLVDYQGGKNRPLQVVMLEARDACSGATGRNGGHITPVLYQDYAGLKKSYGRETAAEIIRFRLAHLTELLKVATEEGLMAESQCRETLSYDVFQDKGLFEQAKELLEEYKREMPEEGAEYEVIEDPEKLRELDFAASVVGCLVTRGGAIHPYRLVTGILARLVKSSLQLYTHTPVTEILETGSGRYDVCTPKGVIRAQHVIHATNAWAGHLVPGLRNKILPARGVMTAQAGVGTEAGLWGGGRSFVLFPGRSFGTFDYLTQQVTPGAELMLGGGFMRNRAYMTELGNADDSGWSGKVGEYLDGALGEYFAIRKTPVVGTWGGILGVSTDGRPWVGRVPEGLTCRRTVADKLASRTTSSTTVETPSGGEWIAAGYSGEGMVHAWLAGQAVGDMIVGEKTCGIPSVFAVGEGRAGMTCYFDIL